MAQKKAPAAPQPATRGAIVEFEESRQRGIVYLEESGGMMTRSAPPVAPEREDAGPKAARAEAKPAEERAASTSTGTNTSTRRAAQRRDAAAAK